jgi:two-component system response regulator CpxR
MDTPRDPGYVLVVDDEESTRAALREVVEMGGCTAVLAANGAEAMRLLRQNRPCLVIVDLVMPVMSGAELIAAMRATPELASIPILVSTSVPDRAPRGVTVLPKPIDLPAVWDCMRRTCACDTESSVPKGAGSKES